MLELIVLGEIPGTRIIITFSWVVAVGTVLVGTEMLRRAHRQAQNHLSNNVEDITL